MHNTIAKSAIVDSLQATIVTIESSFAKGYVGLHLIGHTGEVCRDGRERAKTALEKCGYEIPARRLVLNIAPADLKKDGNHLDLPFAVSVALLLSQKKASISTHQWLFAAELGLQGELRPVRGIISFALAAAKKGLRGIVIARENLPEVRVITELGGASFKDFHVLGFDRLKDVLTFIESGNTPNQKESTAPMDLKSSNPPNFDDMVLSPQVKEVALTSAAGFHSILLRGSPGSGKSMFASRLNSILPRMEKKEHLEILQIQSLYSEKLPQPLLRGFPPYRAPHHHASSAAIMGNSDAPGEISLAHGGILFLDEFPEFRRDIIEALREPLEDGVVHISRSKKKVTWCSRILFVTACNNCPCGWHGSRKRICSCPIQKRHAYQAKLSGPILNRIDIHFNVPEPPAGHVDLLRNLYSQNLEGQTELMRNTVLQARERSAHRNRKFGCGLNRDLNPKDLLQASGLSTKEFELMLAKYTSTTSSPRSVIRSLKVARTIADVKDIQAIDEPSFEQAWLWQEESAAQQRGDKIYTVDEL